MLRGVLLFFGICMAINVARAESLDSLEAHMAGFQKEISQGATDAARQAASDSLRTLLIRAFSQKGVFEYPFEKLIRMATTTSPDGAFRLFNWNVPHLDGTQSYYAFILFPERGGYTELIDSQELKLELENKTLEPDQWYGALYYEIFPVEYKRTTYYTLMGWDGNTKLSTKKVLDVLNIDKKNKVTLGRPIYQTKDGFVQRRIFEYAESARITLRYLKPKEAIVFDRLEPEQPGLEGQYAFYIPGTAYNGYVLNRQGLWELHEFFDMSRPKSAETGAQFNFPDRVKIDRR